MKNVIIGIVGTLAAIVAGAFVISHLGLYPIGADNPPGSLERSLAEPAMDVYADKHKPAGGNPVADHAGSPDGGRQGIRRALCVLPRRREGEDQPDAGQVQPAGAAVDQSHPA